MGTMTSQITSVTIVSSTVYLGADQRKHRSFASLAFVRGIHRWPVNSPHKWPVTRKMFPFDDVLMTRVAISIVPGVISIMISIPFWILVCISCLALQNLCQMIMACAHLAVLWIFLCSHFQTCIHLHRKNVLKHFISNFPKQQSAGPKMHCGRTWEIIAASDFEEQEVRDVIMGKFLIASNMQQYDKF